MTRPSRSVLPFRRIQASPSDVLLEIHIYIVPKEKWQESRHLVKNQVVDETVSIGFVRVIPEISLYNMRREILLQLGPDILPAAYVFLKSVGRNFTQGLCPLTQLQAQHNAFLMEMSQLQDFARVKHKQEHQLKAKNFVPPNAEEPEIHLLDVCSSRLEPLCPSSPAVKLPINSQRDDVLPSTPSSPLQRTPSPPAHAASSEDSGISAVSPSANQTLMQDTLDSNTKSRDASKMDDNTNFYITITKPNDTGDEQIITIQDTDPIISEEKLSDEQLTSGDDEMTGYHVAFVVLEEKEEGEEGGQDDTHIRERLLAEIGQVLKERREEENRRHQLVEKIAELQQQIKKQREKSILEVKQQSIPITAPVENNNTTPGAAGLHTEVRAAHRQLLAAIAETNMPIKVTDGPSKKANYKITAARLQQEIIELQKRVKAVKVRLDSETKRRNEAERDVRQLRVELTQKKVAVSNLRAQTLGTLNAERPPPILPKPPFK